MRSGSEELKTALAAGQRTYDAQVRLGGRDVTREVASWEVSRGSDTSLPAQVATPTGSSAAQAKVALSGQGANTAAARYSPWAPRFTADITRPGQSCVLEWGLAEQRMQALRGRIDHVAASSRSGDAQITALDGAELLRGPAWLPPGVEWGAGYLYTQWVVDHALRESGIYASPPARADSIFFASMNGGRQANIGMLVSTSQIARYYPSRSPWTAGPAVSESGANEYAQWSATYAPQRRVLSQQGTLLMEWWFYRRSISDNPTSQMTLVFADRPPGDTGTRVQTTVTGSYDPATRQMRAQVDGDAITWTLPGGVNQSGRFKVLFLVTLASTSDPVQVRGWLYQPSGAIYSSTTYSGTTPIWGVLDTITVAATGPVECVGVARNPGTGFDIVTPWRRGAQIDIIGEGGAGSAHYRLDVLPQVGGTWWDLLKQIASDQLGYMWFDEDGFFRFRRYDYLTPGSALLPEPDLELTAARDIADLRVEEEMHGVRNRIEVGWSPHTLGSSTPNQVYGYTSVFSIPASSSTAPMRFDLQTRPWSMVAPMLFAGTSFPTGNPGSVVKFVTPTGGRAPVEVEMTWSSGQVEVTFHNRGTSTATAALSSSGNQPSLRLAHAQVDTPRAQAIGRQDTASIARYGTQLLEVAASPWVQNSVWADQLSLALVAWTAWPVPITGAVEVLPDPQVQIGDVVNILDPSGVRVAGLYRVLGYTVRGAGAGVRMTLDVRPLARPALPQDAGLTTEPVLDPAAGGSFPG